MGKNRKLREICAKFVTVVCACLLLFGSFAGTAMYLSQSVMADSSRTVRVGIFPLGKFQYFDEDGEAKGYNIDYLNRIALYNHWNYEYVPVDNWMDATTLLENGEIDLLAPAQKNEALSARFDFAVYSMGTEFAAIYTMADRDDLLYEDFDTMGTLKFGAVAEQTFTNRFIDEYAPAGGFTPDITYYSNMTTLFEGMYAGEVDAVVTNIMFANDNIKLLGRYSPLPVYYITTMGNTDLLAELDDAMTSIKLKDPAYDTELMAEYFPIFNNDEFTYSELEYIKSLSNITIGYDADKSPVSYTDPDTGEWKGITRDILDQIEERTGFQFTYQPISNVEASQEELRQEGIDVVANVAYNNSTSADGTASLSASYLQTESIFVSKSNFQFDESQNYDLAVPACTEAYKQLVAELYPNFTIYTYDTIEECFDAVRKDEMDLLLENRYVVETILSKPIYQNMSVLIVPGIEDQLCLEALSVTDDTFISIIDKAIGQMTAEEVNGIIIQNTASNRYHMTLFDFAYQYRYLLIISLLFLVICMCILIQMRRLEAVKNKQLSISNEQLSIAIGEAERANKAKSQFLARMSHEIRTPMNAIVGMTSLATKKIQDTEKVKEYLAKITISSRVLLNIINDVLDMSAIESDKLKIANAPFDFKELLTGVTTLYYSQCRNKGINFSVLLSKVTEEQLIGDALRVNQILLNLLSNAFKFTPEGGDIKVLVTQMTKKDTQVIMRFEVSDTGEGMTEEMQQRLFKPFEQESATTASEHGGSGLGLSIVKNLVTMMQGSISVRSKKGEGSTFEVTLPFEINTELAEGSSSEETLTAIRALIVDDDTDTCQYVETVLDRLQIQHDTAESGEIAISKLKDAKQLDKAYDVCFVDWKMPGINGIDVTRKIRELFAKDTLVIIVSAYDLSEVEDEAKEAGADLFVTKPLFQSTVFNALMSLSGGKMRKLTASEKEYDFTGHKVLLVEDVEFNQEVAVDILNMVHMDVDCANNGKESLEMFLNAAPGTYDVILMDIQMPIMNGYEATQAIRHSDHPEAGTIPIYAMTANAFTEDVITAVSNGMTGHIAKPIDTGKLYSILDREIQA